MSLIPSESLNFPDSFRAKVGWRLDEQGEETEALEALQHAVAVAKGRSEPAAQPAELTEPQNGIYHPVAAAVPNDPGLGAVAISQPVGPHAAVIPQPPVEPAPPEPLTAEMNALLSHFFSSATAREVSSPSPNEEASMPSLELVPDIASPGVETAEQPLEHSSEKTMAAED